MRHYLEIFRIPSVRPAATGAALASLPIGFLGLSLLLLVRRYESLSFAGLVVACFGVGTVTGMVTQGWAIDAFAGRRLLVVAAAARLAACAGFLALVRFGQPRGTWAVAAFVLGMTEPQVISSLRPALAAVVPPRLHGYAASLSSVLFELPVLCGPVLMSGLVLRLPLELVVVVAAVLSAVGALIYVHTDLGHATGGDHRSAHLLAPLAVRGVRYVVAVAAALGFLIGVAQVTTAAVAGERAGLLFAVLSGTSLVGTAVFGASVRVGLLPVLFGLAAVAGLVGVPAHSPPALLPALVLLGAVAGPIGVASFAALHRVAPPGLPTATTTMLVGAGLAATSAGTAVAGRLVEYGGPALSMATAAGAAALTAIYLRLRAWSV